MPLKPGCSRPAEGEGEGRAAGSKSKAAGRAKVSADEIKGAFVELRPYDAAAHLEKVFAASDGSPVYAHGPYDAEDLVWCYLDAGPFESAKELAAAECMRADMDDGSRFVVLDSATGYVVGMLSLLHNSPSDLRVEVADIWITPAFQRTHVHTDLILTLLRHLFSKQ